MSDITKPVMLNETGVSIANANSRTATALETIAQVLSDGGGGTSGGFNPWSSKKVCVFGDSIGYGYNNNAHSFVDVLSER